MMAAVMGTFLVIILIIVMVLLISCVKIVRQAQALVIERLGAYQATWGTGLHFKLPIVDRVARRVDMKEQVVDFAPQPVITKDNVTMRIDTVVFCGKVTVFSYKSLSLLPVLSLNFNRRYNNENRR